MYFLEWIINSVNGYSDVKSTIVGGASTFFATIATVSGTFIAMGIALFAINMVNSKNNSELRLFIKYDFASSAMITVLIPLLCMALCNYYTLNPSTIIAMETICAFIMVLFITRLINRVYYSALQNVGRSNSNEWMDLIGPNYLVSSPLVPKRYDVIVAKMRMYPKAYAYYKRPFNKNIFTILGRIDTLNFEFDNFVQAFANAVFNIPESSKTDKYDADNFTTESFIKYLRKHYKTELKMITPKIQDTTELYKICMDYYHKSWVGNKNSKEYLGYCILLIASYLKYATKHQNQSFWNKYVGRTNYISCDDSFIYSLYGELLTEAVRNKLIKCTEQWRFYVKAADLKVDNVYAKNKAICPQSNNGKFCSNIESDFIRTKNKCRILRFSYIVLFALTLIDVAMDVIPINHHDITCAYTYLVFGLLIVSIIISTIVCSKNNGLSLKSHILIIAVPTLVLSIFFACCTDLFTNATIICGSVNMGSVFEIVGKYDRILAEIACLITIVMITAYSDETDQIRIHNKQSVFEMESMSIKMVLALTMLCVISIISIISFYQGGSL